MVRQRRRVNGRRSVQIQIGHPAETANQICRERHVQHLLDRDAHDEAARLVGEGRDLILSLPFVMLVGKFEGWRRIE